MRPAPATDVAWLALGTNLGHRGRALQRMRDALERRGLMIEAESSEILTRAVGLRGQPDYHNQVLRVRSSAPLQPHEWLRLTQDAEAAAGRKPTYVWGPRHADIDILLLGRNAEISVADDDLVVPHPRLHERPFISRLLAELELHVP